MQKSNQPEQGSNPVAQTKPDQRFKKHPCAETLGTDEASSHVLPQGLQSPERLLTLARVQEDTGFKSSYLYELIKTGKFPKPVKIGTASRWRESEVQQWIHSQIEGSASGKNAGVRA